MKNFTDTEKLVFNKCLDICYEEPEATVKQLAKALSLEVNSVKGIVGSLVKKGLVTVDEEERGMEYVQVRNKLVLKPKMFLTINPIIENELFSYGWDKYSEAEKETFKL